MSRLLFLASNCSLYYLTILENIIYYDISPFPFQLSKPSHKPLLFLIQIHDLVQNDIFLNITCSGRVLLAISMCSGLTLWHWATSGRALPWNPSCPQLSSVANGSLRTGEAWRAFLCSTLHAHSCDLC